MKLKNCIEKSPFSGTRATMSSLKNDDNNKKKYFLGPDIVADEVEYLSD